MTVEEGNKLIAEFMGYKYFESNVHDNYEARMDNIYSKVPIEIFEDEGCKFFKELPNPDFKKDKPEKWNPEFGLLNWQTLNHGQFIYGVLEYNTSWEWLMEVVEKIEKDCFATTSITNAGCIIKCNDDAQTEYPRFGKPKIQMVWMAVVEYIKWYNLPQQKYLWYNQTQNSKQ